MTIKTEKIVALYNVLSNAKLTKLEDSDKYKVIKILRKLKPVAESFEVYKEDALKRLQPENWEEILPKYSQLRSGNAGELTEEEIKEVSIAVFNYDRKVNECIAEELALEVDIDMPMLSEAAFEKLLASNDWDAKTAMNTADEIVKED